jgi:hypothetical protein
VQFERHDITIRHAMVPRHSRHASLAYTGGVFRLSDVAGAGPLLWIQGKRWIFCFSMDTFLFLQTIVHFHSYVRHIHLYMGVECENAKPLISDLL